MDLLLEKPDIQEYLKCTAIVNFDHPIIRQLGDELSKAGSDEIELAKIIYEYVRDEVAHSGDIDAQRVTCHASDVLHYKHGICCAKSHLLAALLRYCGIPTGFCYQKLLADDSPDTEFILHGLNALYLQSMDTWIRVDARGNKEGVTAEFKIEKEKLAWPVRIECGECDDPIVYAHPWKEIVNALQNSKTRTELHTVWPTLWTPAMKSKFNAHI
jgi:transglutaminase-like putative cysteine protease